MDFIQAARLKHYILKNYNVVLHIHDTCGGLYLSIDEPDEIVREFILSYCREISVPVKVSEDGTAFFPGKEGDAGQAGEIRIVFEEADKRATAYHGERLTGFCSYSESADQWTIDHTFVEESSRNQQIADRLVEKVVEEALRRGKKIVPICSYAVRWFERKRLK